MNHIYAGMVLLIAGIVVMFVYTNDGVLNDDENNTTPNIKNTLNITRISDISANPELYGNKTVIVRGAGRPTYSSNMMTSIKTNDGDCALPCTDGLTDGTSGMCLKAKTSIMFYKNITMVATVQKEYDSRCNKTTWYLYEDRILQDA